MKAFWWKLTVDWPCALGDWLWAYLATPLLASLERLTFKRVIYLAALTLTVMALAQFVTIDLAFLWAGDTVLYFEIASAVMLYAARNRAHQILRVMEHRIRAKAQDTLIVMRRWGRTVRQRRNANALSRKKSGERPRRSDDEPAVWIGGTYTVA